MLDHVAKLVKDMLSALQGSFTILDTTDARFARDI